MPAFSNDQAKWINGSTIQLRYHRATLGSSSLGDAVVARGSTPTLVQFQHPWSGVRVRLPAPGIHIATVGTRAMNAPPDLAVYAPG